MWNVYCDKCTKLLAYGDGVAPDYSIPSVCQTCYDAQEQDFSQKLPVKVRVVWEV